MQGAIINGYQLKHLLGRGGMAEVWYAENEIGRAAAVKILNESLTNNPQIVERFHNEALVMVKLDHPNIRQVYGYGYLGERHCIIMEYLEGDDLEALMQKGRHFTDEELRLWWNQIADTLNYTHAMGVVHRDIKPSNLFLDKKGNIKLLDFGIAKLKESMSMTRTGTMMGTLMYMSPEQVMDSKNIDYRTDVYSLAVTFVHLLSGRAPYDSDTSGDYMVRKGIVEQEFDLSAVPAHWRGFLGPYLSKEPSQRPPLRPFEMVQDTPMRQAYVNQSTMVSNAPYNANNGPATVAGTNQPLPPTPEPAPEHKSKAGLWIGLGVGGGVLFLLLMVLLMRTCNHVPPVEPSRPYVPAQPSTTTTPTNQTDQPTTPSAPKAYVPDGAAQGVFSVGSYKQVYFAKGNLQYQASTGTWRFANNQWDYVGTTVSDEKGNYGGTVSGSDNRYASSTYSGWVDLFSWDDWSTYVMGESWQIPSSAEWNYLFTGRSGAANKRGGAWVNGVPGIVVLPDDWSQPNGVYFSSNMSYSANNYSIADWNKMEEAGAIFLPAAGRLTDKKVYRAGSDCDYWSSTSKSNSHAYNVDLTKGNSLVPQDYSPKTHGFAVRLIKNK